MCAPISSIILKDDILFSKTTHSHTEILKEYGIEDTRKNAETLFVRAEFSPVDGDMFSDIAKWRFRVDQDIRPEWFVKDYEKERMINKSVCYAADHIHIGKDGLELTSGVHWVKDCKNVALYGTAVVQVLISSTVKVMRDNSTVEVMRDSSTVKEMRNGSTVKVMRDSSTVEVMRGNSTVKVMRESSTVNVMRDSSTVEVMWDNSTVEVMRDNSTVKEMWDSSTVKAMRGNSTVNIPNPSSVDQTKIILTNNAIIKDCRTKTIYQCGGWKLVEAGK